MGCRTEAVSAERRAEARPRVSGAPVGGAEGEPAVVDWQARPARRSTGKTEDRVDAQLVGCKLDGSALGGLGVCPAVVLRPEGRSGSLLWWYGRQDQRREAPAPKQRGRASRRS